MAYVTLIMTRKPIEENFFPWGKIRLSGLFGSMALVVGPKIFSANPHGSIGNTVNSVTAGVKRDLAFFKHAVEAVNCAPQHKFENIKLAGKLVGLITDGTPLQVIEEFDTMERYRGDNGQFGRHGFMLTDPRPARPYRLTYQEGIEIIKKVDAAGRCLKIHDHGKRQLNGNTAGLLIHRAPNAGFLTGCISPRLKSANRQQQDKYKETASRDAMDTIFKTVLAIGRREAALIILD